MFDLKSGAILSLCCCPADLFFYAQERVVAGRSYVTVTGKASAAARRETLSIGAKVALLAFCILTVTLILYFYALLFCASIVQAFGANHALTLDHYRVIFTEGLPAIKDTLIVALIGMPLGGLYGIIVGYLNRADKICWPPRDGSREYAELRSAWHNRRHRRTCWRSMTSHWR